MSSTSGEINNLIKVWLTVLTSLTFSYFFSSKLPKGLPRLLSLLPIITLFSLLPLSLSTIHLSGITAFFIAWLANFKLLLFAFDLPPLTSTPHSPHHLLHFISLSCLPIKITTQNPNKAKPQVLLLLPLMNYLIKSLVVALTILIYNYKHYLHPKLLQLLYCIHIYCFLEILLVISTRLAGSLLGVDLEAPFNEPYRSTSLQDFWGRRWNLMVTGILRPTVYKPVRGYFGVRRWAVPAAVMATFVVSGAMHELMFFYLSRKRPDGDMMGFFVLHGVCLVVEITVKKRLRWRLGAVVSVPLTIGFIAATALWLFVPHMVRRGMDARAMEEYAVVARYARKVLNVGNQALSMQC